MYLASRAGVLVQGTESRKKRQISLFCDWVLVSSTSLGTRKGTCHDIISHFPEQHHVLPPKVSALQYGEAMAGYLGMFSPRWVCIFLMQNYATRAREQRTAGQFRLGIVFNCAASFSGKELQKGGVCLVRYCCGCA